MTTPSPAPRGASIECYRFGCVTCDRIFDAEDPEQGREWAAQHAANEPEHQVDHVGETHPGPVNFRDQP